LRGKRLYSIDITFGLYSHSCSLNYKNSLSEKYVHCDRQKQQKRWRAQKPTTLHQQTINIYCLGWKESNTDDQYLVKLGEFFQYSLYGPQCQGISNI